MKRVMISLGVVLILSAGSYAQSPEQGPSKQDSAAVSKSSPSASPTSQAKTQDQKPAASDDGFDKPSAHHTRVRLGGIAVSGGYAHFSGFYPYPFAYDPFYYPFSAVSMSMLWDPFWGYYPPFYPAGYFNSGADKGELKLTGAPKDASVYVNGGYAGTIEHLKSFWLEPGAYDLAVTTADGRRFEQRVYVLTGKILKLEAKPMEKLSEGEKL